jgi:hypothetical protein
VSVFDRRGNGFWLIEKPFALQEILTEWKCSVDFAPKLSTGVGGFDVREVFQLEHFASCNRVSPVFSIEGEKVLKG